MRQLLHQRQRQINGTILDTKASKMAVLTLRSNEVPLREDVNLPNLEQTENTS